LNDPIPSDSNLYSSSTTGNFNNTVAQGTKEPTGIACPACTFQNDPFMIQCEICGTELQDADSIAFMLDRQQQHQRSISNLPSTIRTSSSTPSLSTALGQDVANNMKSSAGGTSKILSGLYSLTGGSSPGSSSKTSAAEDANSVKLSFRAGGIGHFHTLLKGAVATKAWEVRHGRTKSLRGGG